MTPMQPSPQTVVCPNCDFEEAILYVYRQLIYCPDCGLREERSTLVPEKKE